MCYLPVLVLGIPSQYLVAKYSNESALLSVQLYQPVYIYQVPVPLQYIGNMTAVVQAIAIAQLLHGYRRYDKACSCTVGFPSLILLPVLLLVLQLQLVVYGSIGRRQLYQYSCTVQKSTVQQLQNLLLLYQQYTCIDGSDLLRYRYYIRRSTCSSQLVDLLPVGLPSGRSSQYLLQLCRS